jgi:hypothetical protein
MVVTGHTLLVLLLVIFGGGLGVNITGVIVKRLFGIKSGTVMHTVILAITAVYSTAQYILGLHSQLPPEVLGVTGTSIYGWSQVVYRYAKSAAAFFSEVQDWNTSHPTDNTVHIDMPELSMDTAEALASEPFNNTPVVPVMANANATPTDF